MKPKYDGLCRSLDKSIKKSGQYVVRFKMPLSGFTIVNDVLHGRVKFNNNELDDFIILRSDSTPTYNLCVVIDDNFSSITHVLRGDDHLNNAPKQVKIYEALNLKVPKYIHIPMILDSEGKKISKSNNKFDLISYLNKGYLPNALINYLLRLGWSHKNQEIFSLKESLKLFSLKSLQKSSSHNNFEKLNWLNKYYLKKLTNDELILHYKNFLLSQNNNIDINDEKLILILNLQKHRFNNFEEIMLNSKFFFKNFTFKIDTIDLKLINSYKIYLKDILNNFNTLLIWKKELIYSILLSVIEKKKLDKKIFFKVIRICIVGQSSSPPIAEMLEIIGKNTVIIRIKKIFNEI